MDLLAAFGLFAVSAMLVCYALEERSSWFILAFAGSCGLGSAYGFLQGAWPFGLIEAIWALVGSLIKPLSQLPLLCRGFPFRAIPETANHRMRSRTRNFG